MEFDPATLSLSARYHLLIGTIVPRPIAVVGTMDAQGRLNLAPFSFFNAASSDPMVLMFCPANRSDGGEKDTLANAKPTHEGGQGCFSISLAVESTITRVVACAEELAPGESEFDLVGLTNAMCTTIRAPFVVESPVCFECETMSVTRFAAGRAGAGNVVMGRVIHARIDDRLVQPRMHIDSAQLAAIGRLGGRDYCATRQRFQLSTGRAALDQTMRVE